MGGCKVGGCEMGGCEMEGCEVGESSLENTSSCELWE